jgi:hypothetical protein
MDVKLGIFVVPDATDPDSTIEQGEDPIGEIRRLGAEVAPRVREMVG